MAGDGSKSESKLRPKEGRTVTRGLPSVLEAREARRQRQWMPASFWIWALVCIAAGTVVWWKIDQAEINEMRVGVLSKQREVAAELGPRWYPLRDSIAKWTQECGDEAFLPQPAPKLAQEWDFRGMPGIYLRLAQGASKTPAKIQAAAKKSLRDGFSSCLMVAENPSPLAGIECLTTADCARGQVCNEFSHCAARAQPFNLRLAYKSVYLLSDEWVADMQAITNRLLMRGAVMTFEAAYKYDLHAATELLKGSAYFLVVVDEAPLDLSAGLDAQLPDVDSELLQDDRSIATAPHAARVCVWRLSDNKRMFAARLRAEGDLRGPAGATVGVATRISRQRQANSCALGLAVKDAIGVLPGVIDGAGGAGGAGETSDSAGGAASAKSASSSSAGATSAAPSGARP